MAPQYDSPIVDHKKRGGKERGGKESGGKGEETLREGGKDPN